MTAVLNFWRCFVFLERIFFVASWTPINCWWTVSANMH